MRNVSSILKVSTAAATLAFAYVAGGEHAVERASGNPALASAPPVALPGTDVLVVSSPATAGTATGELLLVTMRVPTEQLGSELLPATAEVRSQIASGKLVRAVAAGAPLLRADVDTFSAPSSASGIALSKGYVAMSLSVSPETAVAGLVSPGDRVDVIFTRRLADGDAQARIVLRGSRILAVDGRTISTASITEQSPTTITLEVSAQAAVSLAMARELGQLSVVLSTAEKMTDVPFDIAGPTPETADASGDVDTFRLAQVRVMRGGEPATYSVRRSE